MKKLAVLIYGLISYFSFLGVILYAIGFVGNFGVSNTLDSLPSKPVLHAVMINLGLLSFFAIQHSGMARKGFKNWVKQYTPEAAERSTFVMMSNMALFAVMYFWEPIGGVLWHADTQLMKTSIITVYMFGWALVFISTFLINHFQLFGLQQVWYNFTNKSIPAAKFRTPSLYRMVRHPLYVGFIIVFWSAPTMTVAHLMFASITTIYILLAIQLEEKDLLDELGNEYQTYRQQVPMIIPKLPQNNREAIKAE
jgi:protein-S-isoprenylcysteine O-methyltransferase Ste14